MNETCQIQPIISVLTIGIILGLLMGTIYYRAKIDKLKNKVEEQELELRKYSFALEY